MKRALGRLSTALGTVSLAASAALTAGIFLVVLAQVFSRYVVGSPIDGTDEFARFLFVWATFVGAGAVAATQVGHISTDMLKTRIPPSALPIYQVVHRTLVLVAAAVVAYATYRTVQLTGSQTSASLGVSMRWLYLAPLVGFLLVAVHQVINPAEGTAQSETDPEGLI
ncbi:TRAP transporter small permease [Pseudactinotalea sp. Z1748]|uniref:TRAP transporter small permease n=1 Tax=Pseudactinotalea sp. Z1748 TaxID=3413027 RepID=UPI003C7BD9A3